MVLLYNLAVTAGIIVSTEELLRSQLVHQSLQQRWQVARDVCKHHTDSIPVAVQETGMPGWQRSSGAKKCYRCSVAASQHQQWLRHFRSQCFQSNSVLVQQSGVPSSLKQQGLQSTLCVSAEKVESACDGTHAQTDRLRLSSMSQY